MQVEYLTYDYVVLVKEEFGNEHVFVDDAAYGLVVQIEAQHVQEVVVFAFVLHARQVKHVRGLLETNANKRHVCVQSSRVVSERTKCHSLCRFEFLFENLRETDSKKSSFKLKRHQNKKAIRYIFGCVIVGNELPTRQSSQVNWMLDVGSYLFCM